MNKFNDEKYWFKIGGGHEVTVNVKRIGSTSYKYVFTSRYFIFGVFSYFEWKPKSEDHWYRPFSGAKNGNPFQYNFHIK